jgi:hypothetical protein
MKYRLCQDSTLTLRTANKLHPAPPSKYDDIDVEASVDFLAPNLEGERSSRVLPYWAIMIMITAIAAPTGPRKQPT